MLPALSERVARQAYAIDVTTLCGCNLQAGRAFRCVSARAQQTQPTDPTQAKATGPVRRTTVNEVLVPVVVRDAQGRRVGGLTKDDFQVFDNGEPQTIAGFSIVHRDTESGAANSAVSAPEIGDSPSALLLLHY